MSTVRVVAKVTCDECNGEGLRPAISGGVLVAGAKEWCVDCGGTGTVEREVTCDGCKFWNAGLYCGAWDAFNIPPDHACKTWKPRE